MRLAFWRFAFTAAVSASDLTRRAVEWTERRFLDECMSAALSRASSEYRAATAETIPAPGGDWVGLCGDVPHCEPGDGLHDDAECWPVSGQRRQSGWEA